MTMSPLDIRYHHLMSGAFSRAGFVLVGGRSTRMGRDKALLPLDGKTFAQHIAELLEQSAGSAALIGSPALYSGLGFPVIPDLMPGNGPLGGLFTALHQTSADWNLIVACDMPKVTTALFEHLFSQAELSTADCVVPATGQNLDPLCAVYHRRCAPAALAAIHRKSLKMHDFVSGLKMRTVSPDQPALLANVNTPQDWSSR